MGGILIKMVMEIATLERILIQLCFVTLFVNTLLYWTAMSWPQGVPPIGSWIDRNTTQTEWVDFAESMRLRRSLMTSVKWVLKTGMLFANSSLTILLLERWYSSGHLPFSNLYESFVFLSWSLTFAHVLLQNTVRGPWLGSITAPSAMITQSFASFSLPKDMQLSTALVPALQSNWLMMHVSMMILSYGALLFGSLLAVALLVVSINKPSSASVSASASASASVEQLDKNTIDIRGADASEEILVPRMAYIDPRSDRGTNDSEWENDLRFIGPLEHQRFLGGMDIDQPLNQLFWEIRKMDLLDQLDNWSYRSIGIGFPLLTVGILSGAVWANEAWGSYWSWDPKETWALVTWLIFAIYLHTRMNKGWTGNRSAVVASAGLFVVWACYLGVNLLGKGLHSYGWY